VIEVSRMYIVLLQRVNWAATEPGHGSAILTFA